MHFIYVKCTFNAFLREIACNFKKIMEASGDYSRKNSLFTKEQEIFIVEEFARNPSPKAVKNAFTRKYKSEINFRVLSNIQVNQFIRVRDRFQTRTRIQVRNSIPDSKLELEFEIELLIRTRTTRIRVRT